MPVSLKVYVNEDDALLFWSISAPIPQCRGFAIERKLTDAHGVRCDSSCSNRIGFENEPARRPDGGAPTKNRPRSGRFSGSRGPTTTPNTGDTVSYRVTPVIRKPDTTLTLLPAEASGLAPRERSGRRARRFQPFFNRGFVISQFMARYLKERADAAAVQGDDSRTRTTRPSGDSCPAICGSRCWSC